MILAAADLLRDNPHPTDEEIREGLEGNLCRCTGYENILRAVRPAAQAGAPRRPPPRRRQPGSAGRAAARKTPAWSPESPPSPPPRRVPPSCPTLPCTSRRP